MLISTLSLTLLSYQSQSLLLLNQWLEHSAHLDSLQKHYEMQIIMQQAPQASP